MKMISHNIVLQPLSTGLTKDRYEYIAVSVFAVVIIIDCHFPILIIGNMLMSFRIFRNI